MIIEIIIYFLPKAVIAIGVVGVIGIGTGFTLMLFGEEQPIFSC